MPAPGTLRRIPPLVGSRPQNSPAALPTWLPRGWESWDYPKLEDAESALEWLRYSLQAFDVPLDVLRRAFSDGILLEGVDISSCIRDAFRLVRWLARLKGWKRVPPEPQQRYQSSPDRFRAAAGELRQLVEWVENRLARTRSGRYRTMSLEEANERVLRALKAPKARTLRELATAFGCSAPLIAKTPAWKAYQKRLRAYPKKKLHKLGNLEKPGHSNLSKLHFGIGS